MPTATESTEAPPKSLDLASISPGSVVEIKCALYTYFVTRISRNRGDVFSDRIRGVMIMSNDFTWSGSHPSKQSPEKIFVHRFPEIGETLAVSLSGMYRIFESGKIIGIKVDGVRL